MFNDESDIIIAYGDIIYEKRILEELFSCNSSISLTADLDWEKLWKVRLDNPLSDAETFKIDSFGFIKELGKKPNSYREVEAQYMGLIKINSGYQRSLLQYYLSLDKSNKYDGNSFDNMYMTSFIQGLIDNSWKVSSVLVNGGWLEIDTLNDFKIYNTMYDKGTLSKYYKYE